MIKILKIAYFALLAVVLLTIGYFITSCTQFNRTLKQEAFINGYYQTKNTDDFISFGDFNNTVLCVDEQFYFINEVNYDKGIFTLVNNVNEKTFKVGVINKDVIYFLELNTYFYNIDLWEERS